MCDFSGRLIAWMDGELAENEAAEVERHVQACSECRECLSACEDASRGFAAYYAATARVEKAPAKTRRVPLWVPAAAAIAAIAAMLVLVFMSRATKQAPVVQQVATVPAPAAATKIAEPTSPPVQQVAKRHVVVHKKQRATDFAFAGPAIQIAIPAEAMFPPGALPEGVTYIANLSLAPDGTVQGIQLQP
jgi:anti-sigma factor RsiW